MLYLKVYLATLTLTLNREIYTLHGILPYMVAIQNTCHQVVILYLPLKKVGLKSAPKHLHFR